MTGNDIPSIPFQTMMTLADTGDVVLWTGLAEESLGVEILSESVYSHASMVIKDPETGAKYLLQAISEALLPDPLAPGGKAHSGVQAGDLASAIKTIALNYPDGPSWRQFTWADRPADFDQQVWDAATKLDGIPFPATALDLAATLVKGRWEQPPVEVRTPLFCSGLVAEMLMAVGVIDTQYVMNSYFPKDFSMYYPGHLNVLHGSYGTDMMVTGIAP